ncbi:alpha-mannosidase, partial [bacterium]|nr:alpha-mannosidase [bacterium]
MSTRKTVFLIGNAHLDPVWLWRWQEGCAEVRNTCRAAAGFIDEFPGFVFTRSSAGDMRWIEETEPGLFKTIQQHARAGHWSNAGGWWTQPDCTIPCGESFVRQGLY